MSYTLMRLTPSSPCLFPNKAEDKEKQENTEKYLKLQSFYQFGTTSHPTCAAELSGGKFNSTEQN